MEIQKIGNQYLLAFHLLLAFYLPFYKIKDNPENEEVQDDLISDYFHLEIELLWKALTDTINMLEKIGY